ncbi:MAG: hypothetical protein V3R56_04610 [Xanthomonadales bacterium]
MGLFDVPAPLFAAIDGVLAMALPSVLRLMLWGILAGWLTMVVYRRLSNQEKIGELKGQQKVQQKEIAEFDGEFEELMPLIRHTLALGFKQLGLALGPALLSTLPVLFLIVWVAGAFGNEAPATGSRVHLTAEPANDDIHWSSTTGVETVADGWQVNWPENGQSLTLTDGRQALLTLPLEDNIPIIHKKKWWNLLMANPVGYLPDDGKTEVIHIDLPEQVIIGFGPGWMRGWMFSFFLTFLLSSLGFKFLLRID